MQPIEPIPLEAIRAARERVCDAALRTPLIRLNVDEAPAEVYLKLENLQPIGSFKVRGAANAVALADPASLANGVYTASAGNMAQGLAFIARKRELACSVVVPDSAPQTKLAAIERLALQRKVVSRFTRKSGTHKRLRFSITFPRPNTQLKA